MDYPNYLGGSYTSQSPIADGARLINWYTERVEGPGARAPLAFYPVPGSSTFVSTTDAVGRGAFTMAGRTHFVIGGGVWEVFGSMTASRRGSVAQDANPASMTYNGSAGNRLCIASGGTLYYLNLSSNAVSAVSGVTKGFQVGMIDGFFVNFDITTNRIYVSPLNDTSGVWDPSQFAQRSTQPDPWQAMYIAPPDIWLIGEQTGDVWYDAGAAPFPLAPRSGITFKYGIIAPFSLASIGSSVYWLARDKDGSGVVVQTRGYSPMPVSSKALETAISNYKRTSTIANAEGMTYEQEGHSFYCLRFPSVPATWVYDPSLPPEIGWHERGTWNSAAMRYDVWRPRVHTFAFGQNLTADGITGNISTIDVSFGTESDGTVIRRLRIPPPLYVGERDKRLFVSRFEPIFEQGLGTATDGGFNPTVMLRTSINGKTWSNHRTHSAGLQGQYSSRTYFLRNGSSTLLWQPEIVVSDPIPWRHLGAEIDARGFRQTRTQ